MTKQATLIDHEKMIHNIVSVYRDADETQHAEGLLWYSNAQKAAHDIAVKHDVRFIWRWRLSPRFHRITNGREMLSTPTHLIGAFIRGDGVDSVKVSTYHKMKAKAWDILAARPDYDGAKAMLKGQKITSFFMDIMGEFNVTIDGHARNIAYGERVGLTDDRTNIGVREYRALQAAYEEAARRVGLMPYQLQAITWRVWRDRHGITNKILSAHCFKFCQRHASLFGDRLGVSCAIVRGRDCRAGRIGGETMGPADHRRKPTFLA